jgi:hypothetical protein
MLTKLWYSVAVIALIPAIASAEGLLFQLPEDGHWVRFQVEGKTIHPDRIETTQTGTITMSSVGKAEINGQKCRWIEIVMAAKFDDSPSGIGNYSFTDIDKLLIPEEHLAKGKEPLKHVVKSWHKHSLDGGAAQQVEDVKQRLQQLQTYLHGPFKATKELEAVRIDSTLGKLDCKGIAASETIEEGGATVAAVTYSIRLHEKAPFGVVGWEIEVKVLLNGKTVGTSVQKLKVAAVGTDAKSTIPDAN